MKTTLLLCLTLSTLLSTSQAAFFGRVDTYLETKTGKVITLAADDIEDGEANFYDYQTRSERTVQLSELSKETLASIDGVKKDEAALITTLVNESKNQIIKRHCLVLHVFENRKISLKCTAYEADRSRLGVLAPHFLISADVSQVTAEVSELDGISKNDITELKTGIRTAKAGKKVRVLALFNNGEALVQKIGISSLDTSDITHKSGVELVDASILR